MKNPSKVFAGLALGLIFSACGGDPLKPAVQAMRTGDLAGAEAQLDTVAKGRPDLKEAHALRLVLFRHLMVNGSPEKHEAYLQKAIQEYDILVKALGLKPDYADMEGSLRSSPEGAALLAAARKPLYGE